MGIRTQIMPNFTNCGQMEKRAPCSRMPYLSCFKKNLASWRLRVEVKRIVASSPLSVKFCEIFFGFGLGCCTSYKIVVILRAKCAKTTFQ